MKTAKMLTILVLALGLIVCLPKVSQAAPMGTAFTYQGRLIDANKPADGLYDLQCKLYDANVGGTQKGSTLDVNEIDVIDGLFTVLLDFGSDVFDGNTVWLEIGVRAGELKDPNAYTTLSPRQEITPVPYALHTQGIFLDATNTLVGLEAGAVNSGAYNTFSGYQAGYSNTEGLANTFSGYQAGYSNTDGMFNTFSGYKAGYYNTEGVANTFLGLRAGQSNTTGNSNTFLGNQAGYLNTEGNSNTFLGQLAGRDNATGSGNVFIGWCAGYNETGSNKLYIANSSANPPLIYGDFSTGNVGIGTTTPTAKLDVAGLVKITGGSPAAGKVLISDAAGLATWQTLPAGGDITAVNAGTGLSGGGTSGDVTLAVSVPLSLTGAVADAAVIGATNTNTGSGYGVKGSGSSYGVYGSSSGSGKGVYGSSSTGTGVYGAATHSAGTNYGGYFTSFGNTGYGVYAEAWEYGNYTSYGGYFKSSGSTGYGVYGENVNSGPSTNYGGYFETRGLYGMGISGKALNTQGIGVYGKGGSLGYAAQFDGKVRICDRDSGSTVMLLGKGLDYAEGFDVSEEDGVSPGTVLVIDRENPGKLAISRNAYDKKVAGIVAGAKGLTSGVRLGVEGFDCDVALAGRVYCNVDAAEYGIEPGDMLTTSDNSGYAMKAADYARASGAILGKAMEKLEKGQKGQILVLVTLQ